MDENITCQPTVSVIIPVYNGEAYVCGAIESVLNQTFKDFEIIVVDDGSTDETKNQLDSWVNKGKIRYVYQQNKGLAGARNTGLKLAKGTFIKFLDCDDVLYPEQLERQVMHLKNKPDHVISATDFELEFENGNKRKVILRFGGSQLAQFIKGNPCPVHTIMVRRTLVEQAKGFDEILLSHEDSDLWVRILLLGGCFEKIEMAGCLYRILDKNLSANAQRMFEQECKYYEKINRRLITQFDKQSKETLTELLFSNIFNIHKCFARKMDPKDRLPVTLCAISKIERLKNGIIRGVYLEIMGVKKVIYKEYQKDCLEDKENSEKLKRIGTIWREEQYYDDPHFLDVLILRRRVKNILYFNSTSVVYGAETRLLDIIRNLDRDKYRPFALLPVDGPLVLRLHELKVKVMFLECRFYINRSNFMKFLRLNWDFVRMVQENHIDLIHVNLHLHFSNLWLAFLILRKPLIIHLRSHFYLHIFEKFVMCRAFKVICISVFTKQSFLTRRRSTFFMGHTANHTVVIHDGIDVNRFYPHDTGGKIRRELNVPENDFLVGIVGAVDKIKGQDILVRAAKIVVERYPQAKFLIIGDLYGTYESALKYRADLIQLIKDLELQDKVILHGFRGDIEILMNELDLLVQPSEREALGTSMVEAMACGKPVIGTEIDGIPEVIGNNESGMLLNPRTPEQLAKLIINFIENPEAAKKKGLQGRKRVLENFNVHKNIQRIHHIYQEAIDERK